MTSNKLLMCHGCGCRSGAKHDIAGAGPGYAVPGMHVRFDDLRPHHQRSFEFSQPEEILVTDSPAEVSDIIAVAEERAAAGRWVPGFLSYEAASGLDPGLTTHPPSSRIPLAWFGVFSNRHDDPPWPDRLPHQLGEWEPDLDRASHEAGLDAIQRYIGAGDTYQVNYTLRLAGRFSGDPLSAYCDLVLAQSGGFGAFFDLGDLQVLSASPELFFRWDGNGITTRPMKGTIGRGRWPGEDEQQRLRLAASEKDRAENLMIVDLLRNDLGRIAEYGSVEVTDLFAIERYETVWQMTSTIRGQPRSDVRLTDVLAGLFPSGSVTGAPKARTMEIIRELETSPRGVYCGAVGVLAPPGSGEPRAQFNVAIRTVVIDATNATAEYGTGGGITWDSVAAAEFDEALVKARVLTHSTPDFSLLETMRWSPADGIVRRRRHLERLRASADYFGLPFPAAAINTELDAVAGDDLQRVRLLVGRDGRVVVEVSPLIISEQPVSLALDTHRVDSQDLFLFHKTTHRATYEDATKRHPTADDVMLVNEHDLVTETTRANLAARFGDDWLTPPIGDGCLPGTYRAELIEGCDLREESIPVSSLPDAHELATFNSLWGWRRAELVGP